MKSNRQRALEYMKAQEDYTPFDLIVEGTQLERKALHNVLTQMVTGLYVTRDKMDGKTFYKVTALGRAWKPDTDKRRQRAFNHGSQPKIDIVNKAN